ncbi:MAG: hypothetical protein ACI89J_001345 [Hyphomicrobiaceae bacterium]|jgi:hypothetical protein
MSLSPQEVNSIAAQSGAAEDADIIGGHLDARSTQRRVLMHCSLVGLIGVAILVSIIAGHVPNAISATLLN